MDGSQTTWILQAARGDRQAFMALVEAHWRRLVALARSVIGDLEAEDAVQDGLLDAWAKLGRLKDPSAFGFWISRIVLRRCLKRARRTKFHLPLEAAPEPESPDRPGKDLDIDRILASLAPRQRAVMYLTHVEGRSDREIAELLQIGAASVRSHRRRARQSLQTLIPQGEPR